MLVAYEILYNTGFFGLLYSAYTLVTVRYVLAIHPAPSPHVPYSVALANNPPNDPVSRLLRLRIFFRFALMAAVAIGITGAIKSTNATTIATLNSGNTLRKVAIYIFLVCAVLVCLQTFILARVELSGMSLPPLSPPPPYPPPFTEDGYRGSTHQIGSTYGVYILLLISILLVVREAFFTATADNTSEQNNEAIWYPLSVVTEFIAVVLFTTPGLVPPPKDS